MESFAGWHLVLLLVVVALLVLLVGAIISIASNRHASALVKAVWILIALMFPVLGPIVWFAIGRQTVTTTDLPGGS